MDVNSECDLDENIVSNFFESNDFFIVYQKKIDLNNPETILAVECYLRLKSDYLEPYSPAIFMPVVKRMGLLPELTIRLVKKLVEDWQLMQLMEMNFRASINLEIQEIENTELIDSIIDIIENSTMPFTMLGVDLILGGDYSISATLPSINRLKEKGITISADLTKDCALTVEELQQLSVEEIKLPRSRLNDENFINQYVQKAKELNIDITAVGIENETEEERLKQLGVQWAQGHLYGQAVNIQQFQQLTQAPEIARISEEPKMSIVVLENASHYHGLLNKALPEGFNLVSIQQDDLLPEVVTDLSAEILVIEINENDTSRFDLVKPLQENNDENLSVIYVADRINQQQLLKSFNNHGFAFIEKSKPVFEFITTVNQAISAHSSRKKLLMMAQESSQLAMQSIRDASQYGDIVQLMKSITISKNEAEISKHFFQYMKQRELSSSIAFNKDGQLTCFCSRHIHCTPTEQNVFELLRPKGRLYEFGERIVVNGNHVSFMIKNMPADEELKGQIRDYIAVIIECMDARYQGILQNRVIGQTVNDLLSISQDAMSTVKSAEQKKQEMIDYLNTEIAMSFHVLDLSIEQEEYLKNMVSKLINEQDWETENNNSIADRLEATIKKLGPLFENTTDDTSDINDTAEDTLFEEEDDVLF